MNSGIYVWQNNVVGEGDRSKKKLCWGIERVKHHTMFTESLFFQTFGHGFSQPMCACPVGIVCCLPEEVTNCAAVVFIPHRCPNLVHGWYVSKLVFCTILDPYDIHFRSVCVSECSHVFIWTRIHNICPIESQSDTCHVTRGA